MMNRLAHEHDAMTGVGHTSMLRGTAAQCMPGRNMCASVCRGGDATHPSFTPRPSHRRGAADTGGMFMVTAAQQATPTTNARSSLAKPRCGHTSQHNKTSADMSRGFAWLHYDCGHVLYSGSN
jgi:hypothetical protein